MKIRFTLTASCASILSMLFINPAMAQNNDYEEDNGAYLEQMGDYYNNPQQGAYQNPYQMQALNIPGAQTVQITDQQNPSGRAMLASTRQIPAGWRASGGVNWRQNNNLYCGLMTPHTVWSASSPDGQSKIEIWPEERFSGTLSPIIKNVLENCPNSNLWDTRGFAKQFVLNKRRGAQITNMMFPTPSEKAMLQQLLPPLPHSQDYSLQQSQDINAAKVNLTYQENGRTYDEVVYVSWITVETSQSPMMGMPSFTIYNAISPQAFSMRAPSGQLDEAQAEAYHGTEMPNPVHQAITRQYHTQKAKELSQQLIAESKARMTANRRPSSTIGSTNPVGDIIAAGGPESGRNPNGHADTIHALRGVDVYNDPYSPTGTVEGTTGEGDSMYRMDDGSYVQTDDPFFNEGTKLERWE